jgi:hypothetical protein
MRPVNLKSSAVTSTSGCAPRPTGCRRGGTPVVILPSDDCVSRDVRTPRASPSRLRKVPTWARASGKRSVSSTRSRCSRWASRRGWPSNLDIRLSRACSTIAVRPPIERSTSTESLAWGEAHPATENASTMVSRAPCTTSPKSAARPGTMGYPRRSHRSGYSARVSIHRRGQASISLRDE